MKKFPLIGSLCVICLGVVFLISLYHVNLKNIIPVNNIIIVTTEHPYVKLSSILQFYNELLSTYDSCKNFKVFGNGGKASGDFWKNVCMDKDVLPKNHSCLVYSFGVGSNWSFDEDMVKYFGCDVYMFDPTVDIPDDKLINQLHFYQIGISGKDTNIEIKLADYADPIMHGSFKTLRSLKKMLGHENRNIDFLKLDVEGAEFDALEDCVQHPETLEGVKQISVEFHTNQVVKLEPKKGLIIANQYYKTLQRLEDLGYKKVFVNAHSNAGYPHPPQMDVHYLYRPSTVY